MGILWEVGFWPFLVITVALGGGAAWMAGHALAGGWRPLGLLVLYMVLLGLAVRFFHYALGHGTLLSLHYVIVDTVVVTALAVLSYRMARTQQMVDQYPWLYRRTSPVSWSER